MNSSAPGSSLYYSLMGCDKATREKNLTLRHIYKKLSNIKPVATQWWHNELSQKHPELLPLLENFLKDTQISLYEEDLALHNFYRQSAGLLERQFTNSDSAENLGIFIAKVEHLCNLRQHLEKGKIYFSGEQLVKHHVNLYELSQLKLTENIKALFQEEAQNIRGYFPKTPFSVARPTQRLATIQKALLDEIEKAGFPVFTHQIGLTPLRKWWIALRH